MSEKYMEAITNIEQLRNLAKYYRDLLFSLSSQAGKHFVDINAVLRYGLTADLSIFVPEIEELITNGMISFSIEKATQSDVNRIIEKADEIEGKEEQGELPVDAEISPEEQAKKIASAILIAIYRKQQFDPYNREVIIGFPLVSGKIVEKKFCAPLFYYKARIDFDPLKNIITLIRDFEIPALNFQLIKYLVESDEDIEMIRQQILPYLYREDFGISSIKEIIKTLSELVEGFKGIAYLPQPSNLKTALEARECSGAKVLNTSIIFNARRTNAYLVDDLTQLTLIKEIDSETVIDTILSVPTEDEIREGIEDPVTSTSLPPLLFPLLNNKSQRLAAVKAEKSRLLVIQGPPGTGKSQTIVNLICHLVAQGKTVLVTSHQNKALEVITKALPNIDYLAMSLLKGEKESLNELLNKIEGFHSHVSSGDIYYFNKLLEDRWKELRKIDHDIKKLQVRFSELKILERDRCSTYHRYHKIRDYDFIDSSDSVPEGMETSVAVALKEYAKLLQKLRGHYSEIESLPPGDKPVALKTMIKHYSVFLQYCELRNYDIIDPNDSIPPEMDTVVSQSLAEYLSLLLKLKNNYSDIEKILPYYDPTLTDNDHYIVKCKSCNTSSKVPKEESQLGIKCGHCKKAINIKDDSIDDAIENIGQLILAYDWIKENLLDKKELLDFCRQLSQLNLSSEELINYLYLLLQWVDKYCHDLIASLKILSESFGIKTDFQTIKRATIKYETVIGDIIDCAEHLQSKLQILREYTPEDNYPEHPDNNTLEEITLRLETLNDSRGSWLKWHLSSKARNACKFLISHKFPKVIYKRRADILEKIRIWHTHWSLRNQIVKDLKYLSEMGIPINHLSSQPPIGELYHNANLAQKYIRAISALNEFPTIQLDTIKTIIEQQIEKISTHREISAFKEYLEKSKVYLETCCSLNRLKSNSHFACLCSSLFSPIEEAIFQLTADKKADETINRLKELYPYFYDYKRLKILEQTTLKILHNTCVKLQECASRGETIQTPSHPELFVKAFRLASYVRENLSKDINDLNEVTIKNLFPYLEDYVKTKILEQTDLKTLPITLFKIKETILKGNDVPALRKPELIVEAFRLSSFIREDLLKNPDNINEIAATINKLKNESREWILKILDASRKLALKTAESNREILFLIAKLKQILKRKRKTYSFVQLREQIDYRKLLPVFPCWIMSIEDVARIFPLQAGLFDYLIIDEASQCNQATSLHLAYRAKRIIVVGDSKQMKNPNTQFLGDAVVQLNLTKHMLDNHPKAAFLHGRNSLLDLAIGCQDISPVFLNEHFRCEPPIIEFSNKRFYDGRLKLLTPFRQRRFSPCMEIRQIHGAYDEQDTRRNVVEAKAVIAELKRMISNGELVGDRKDEKLTVGILSLFREQASLLQSMMYEAFEDKPHILKEHEMIASTVDGFQGDERDVILYSFRYAPNSKPGIIHPFQREDEHSLGRLNVAFSRARRKVICFISLPVNNFPKGPIREYLNHVLSVQNSSYNRLGNPNEREKCQSDFERDIFDELVKRGLEVYTQVPCAGFFIDFVVIDKKGRRMAVECDGEFHYEDGELREEDYQRQDIIERYGWFVHRISSRRYYANPQKAIAYLLADLENQRIDEEISVEPLKYPEHFEAQGKPAESIEDNQLLFEDKLLQKKLFEIG